MRSRSEAGLRSTSRISSASWSRRSGNVSRTSTPVSARDAVVEALEVLDVDRRPDVDAGVQQPLDVLVALAAASEPRAFVWASSSMIATVGRRSSSQSMSGSVSARLPAR